MRALIALGVVLLLVGLAMLAWPNIPYTSRETAVDIGPLEVEAESQEFAYVPPLLGVASAASGIALIVVGRRRLRTE